MPLWSPAAEAPHVDVAVPPASARLLVRSPLVIVRDDWCLQAAEQPMAQFVSR
jgi:hypothetical protein